MSCRPLVFLNQELCSKRVLNSNHDDGKNIFSIGNARRTYGRIERFAVVVLFKNSISLHIYKLALCGLRDRAQTKNAFYTPKEMLPNLDEDCDRAHGF
jgi:hypothetical protein